MNLVDVNILIYAVNSDSPHHEKARKWLENALSGSEPLGFPARGRWGLEAEGDTA